MSEKDLHESATPHGNTWIRQGQPLSYKQVEKMI